MKASWLVRVGVGLALVVAGVAIYVWGAGIQTAESRILAVLVSWALNHPTVPATWGPVVFWNGAQGQLYGLDITPTCSSGRVAAPLLLTAGALAAVGRLRWGRVVLAALIAIGVIVAINQARMVMIAFTINRYGSEDASLYAHTLAGSLVTVAGVAASLAIGVRVAFGGKSKGSPREL